MGSFCGAVGLAMVVFAVVVGRLGILLYIELILWVHECCVVRCGFLPSLYLFLRVDRGFLIYCTLWLRRIYLNRLYLGGLLPFLGGRWFSVGAVKCSVCRCSPSLPTLERGNTSPHGGCGSRSPNAHARSACRSWPRRVSRTLYFIVFNFLL